MSTESIFRPVHLASEESVVLFLQALEESAKFEDKSPKVSWREMADEDVKGFWEEYDKVNQA